MKNIEHNKWKLTGAGCVILFVMLLVGYVKPVMDEILGTYNEWKAEEQKIAAAANWKSRMKQFNEQQDKLEAYLSEVYVSLPENDQMSTIVNEIFREARRYNVGISEMRPAEIQEHPSHMEIPVTINFAGSYHEIGRFINAIEHSKYLMKLDQLELQAVEERASKVEGQAQIKVIILNESLEDTDA